MFPTRYFVSNGNNYLGVNKIVCLSWNLIPSLTPICGVWWYVHFVCFGPEIPFLGKFGAKKPLMSIKLKFPLLERLIPNYQICYKFLLNLVNLIIIWPVFVSANYLKFLKMLQLCRASCWKTILNKVNY